MFKEVVSLVSLFQVRRSHLYLFFLPANMESHECLKATNSDLYSARNIDFHLNCQASCAVKG